MKHYSHTQSTGSTNWVINHNLNSDTVSCDVYVLEMGSMEKILPYDVQFTSNNTTTVIFTEARTGRCRVISQNFV